MPVTGVMDPQQGGVASYVAGLSERVRSAVWSRVLELHAYSTTGRFGFVVQAAGVVALGTCMKGDFTHAAHLLNSLSSEDAYAADIGETGQEMPVEATRNHYQALPAVDEHRNYQKDAYLIQLGGSDGNDGNTPDADRLQLVKSEGSHSYDYNPRNPRLFANLETASGEVLIKNVDITNGVDFSDLQQIELDRQHIRVQEVPAEEPGKTILRIWKDPEAPPTDRESYRLGYDSSTQIIKDADQALRSIESGEALSGLPTQQRFAIDTMLDALRNAVTASKGADGASATNMLEEAKWNAQVVADMEAIVASSEGPYGPDATLLSKEELLRMRGIVMGNSFHDLGVLPGERPTVPEMMDSTRAGLDAVADSDPKASLAEVLSKLRSDMREGVANYFKALGDLAQDNRQALKDSGFSQTTIDHIISMGKDIKNLDRQQLLEIQAYLEESPELRELVATEFEVQEFCREIDAASATPNACSPELYRVNAADGTFNRGVFVLPGELSANQAESLAAYVENHQSTTGQVMAPEVVKDTLDRLIPEFARTQFINELAANSSNQDGFARSISSLLKDADTDHPAVKELTAMLERLSPFTADKTDWQKIHQLISQVQAAANPSKI